MPVTERKALSRPARWLGWFVLLLLSANACGVFWANPAPTRVAEGRYYASGDPEFDEFFLSLHRVQAKVEAFSEREHAAMASLAEALAVQDQELGAIKEKLAARMTELHDSGTRTNLVHEPHDQPEHMSLAVRVQGRAPEDEERSLLSTIETSGSTLLELTVQAARAKDELETLSLAAIRLEPKVGDRFRKEGPAKTDEVSTNLRDARKAIAAMTSSLDTVNDRSTKLVALLKETVGVSESPTSTPAAVATETPPVPEPPAPARRPTTVRKPAPKRPAPAPPTKPQKPASAPASDFEP